MKPLSSGWRLELAGCCVSLVGWLHLLGCCWLAGGRAFFIFLVPPCFNPYFHYFPLVFLSFLLRTRIVCFAFPVFCFFLLAANSLWCAGLASSLARVPCGSLHGHTTLGATTSHATSQSRFAWRELRRQEAGFGDEGGGRLAVDGRGRGGLNSP